MLSIDFRQMPWSTSSASWRYHGADVWDAVQSATSADGSPVLIDSPASANPHLAGVLRADSAGFHATINVAGAPESLSEGVLSRLGEGSHTRFLKGVEVRYAASGDGALSIYVDVRFGEMAEHRVRFMLETIWDLQFLAVNILRDFLGVSNTPPDKARQVSLLRSLAKEQAE